MNDKAIALATEINNDRGFLPTVRYIRTLGVSFQSARKYATEIRDCAPWMIRAAKRFNKSTR